jgi:hypothetical protein
MMDYLLHLLRRTRLGLTRCISIGASITIDRKVLMKLLMWIGLPHVIAANKGPTKIQRQWELLLIERT